MVPHERENVQSPEETKAWRSRLALLAAEARRGFTVGQTLQTIEAGMEVVGRERFVTTFPLRGCE
jgi:hypothetical protein